MAKSLIEKPKKSRRKKPAGTATYFQSLELENIRCFGDRQRVDFTDESGRPVQWTVILGDNGVGKTTLLQALAGSENISINQSSDLSIFPRIARNNFSSFLRSDQSKDGLINVGISIGTKLNGKEHKSNIVDWPFQFTNSAGDDKVHGKGVLISNSMENADQISIQSNLFCYGYGAGRRIGKSSLSEDVSGDTAATLYSEEAPLLNAEEWLLVSVRKVIESYE